MRLSNNLQRLTLAAVAAISLCERPAIAVSLSEIEQEVTNRKFALALNHLESLDPSQLQEPKVAFMYARCLIEAGRFDDATEQLHRCTKAKDTRMVDEANRMLRAIPLMKKSIGNSTKAKPLGYTGLGLSETGTIKDVLAGSSADRAGVKPGDVVVEVDGAPAPSDYHALLSKIRGPKNTVVTLGVLRANKKMTFKVTRASTIGDLGTPGVQINAWNSGRPSTAKPVQSQPSKRAETSILKKAP
jgi:hypothetical protein